MIEDVRDMRTKGSDIEDGVVCLLFLRALSDEYNVLVQIVEKERENLTIKRLRTGLWARLLLLLLLLLFLTFSALVANPKKLLYTVANPARGLLNREKKKRKVWQRTPPPPPCALLVRRKNKK